MDKSSFKSVQSIYRPGPFWSWNDKLNKTELVRQIKEMADKGWGSYFMHSRVGLVTGYLSEEWMELVNACAEAARETGTYAWLYDEDKWPSGFAGGEVPEMDENFRARALVLIKVSQLTDCDTILDKVELNGEAHYICKRVAELGSLRFNGASYVDLMNPKAVEAFINCTHERYKKSCGQYFGKEIPGIFTDEPCYLMAGHYDVPALPWSEYLADYFYKLKGYFIEGKLAELFLDKGDYHKTRFDFFDTATRLFIDSFTIPYANWCQANNLIMTGHYMAEDNLVSQTQWIGAAMPHYQYMDWPGIDKLGRHLEQLVTVKQVTSAVDQLSKERSFCEVFGTSGQQVSFFHRKWIADWQAVLGISFVNHHLSLYSMRGERKRDFPPNFFYQQPWWEEEKPFADYIGRLSYAVSQGKRDVDVLILHPLASVWSEYSPLHKKNNLAVEKEVYDNPFNYLSRELLANKIDFHYGDEMIMENHAKVENGKLKIGCHSYSTIIVPPSLILRDNTVQLLHEFAHSKQKGNLIFIEPYPRLVDGESCNLKFKEEISVNDVDQTVAIVDNYYENRIVVTDKLTGSNAVDVICQQRLLNDNGKMILLSNTSENREVQAKIQLPGKQIPVVCDLMTGEYYKIPAEVCEEQVILDVNFAPAGSLLLLYQEYELELKQVPSCLDSGISFWSNLKTHAICDDLKVSFLEENVLLLNNLTLTLNGEQILYEQPVAQGWHDYFYQALDGSPFKAEYSFDILEVPAGDVFAVIEVAENLDVITCNGKTVTPLKTQADEDVFDPEKTWKDLSFTKVPLKGVLVVGKNSLVLEGKKINNVTQPGCHLRVDNFQDYRPTEVEEVYLVGDFQLIQSTPGKFVIDGSNRKELFAHNLTWAGYPFYAGKAKFETKLAVSSIIKEEKMFLQINKVNAADLQLYINNKYVGVKYWEPYLFDVSQFITEGDNEIKIIAATTLVNLTGPNRIAGIEETKFVSPRTFVNFSQFTEEYTLFPFGIGSISLVSPVDK